MTRFDEMSLGRMGRGEDRWSSLMLLPSMGLSAVAVSAEVGGGSSFACIPYRTDVVVCK